MNRMNTDRSQLQVQALMHDFHDRIIHGHHELQPKGVDSICKPPFQPYLQSDDRFLFVVLQLQPDPLSYFIILVTPMLIHLLLHSICCLLYALL